MSGWGVAHYPMLLPGTQLTLTNTDAPQATLVALIVVFIVAMVLIGPSFMLLFTLQEPPPAGRSRTGNAADRPRGAAGGRTAQAIPGEHPGLATRPAVLGVIRARRDQPPTESSLNRISGTAEATMENTCWAAATGRV